MRNLPKGSGAEGRTFTLADFYEAGREGLSLELLAGEKALKRVIEEPIINRPGLALTGFLDHFAWRRLQLIGKAETAYLNSLSADERVARFRALLDLKANFFVFTNGQRPHPEVLELLDEKGAVVMASPVKTRLFSSRAMFVFERLAAPTATIYGTMIEVSGIGVLFEGDPGLGKSETALGLIKRGHALIADDLTCIRKEIGTGCLFASASESTAGYMEIRGIGILHIPSIFGINAVRGEKRLQLVITFRNMKDVRGEIDRIGQVRHYKNILGVDIPNVIIPVSEGRDLVNLVETAAQQQKLINTGFDPVRSLSERLRRRASGDGSEQPIRKKGRRNG